MCWSELILTISRHAQNLRNYPTILDLPPHTALNRLQAALSSFHLISALIIFVVRVIYGLFWEYPKDYLIPGAWSRGMIFASHIPMLNCERSRVQFPSCPAFFLFMSILWLLEKRNLLGRKRIWIFGGNKSAKTLDEPDLTGAASLARYRAWKPTVRSVCPATIDM